MHAILCVYVYVRMCAHGHLYGWTVCEVFVVEVRSLTLWI